MAIASMMGRPTGIRKARTALSVSDKKKVLDELKAGKPTMLQQSFKSVKDKFLTFVSILTQLLTLSRAKPIITVHMLCKIKVLRVAGKHS